MNTNNQRTMRTIKEIAETIKQMEVDLGLLNEERFGRQARLVWESCRFAVMMDLRMKLAGCGLGHDQPKMKGEMDFKELFLFCANLLFNSITNSWLWAPKNKEWLIFQHARRKKRNDGFYEDVYTEDILEELGINNCVNFEAPHSRKHFTPRTHKVWFDELNALLAYFSRPYFKIRIRKYNNKLEAMNSNVTDYLQKKLDTKFNFLPLFSKRSLFLKSLEFSYRTMLKWLKPQKILVVVSYGNESLILAAKKLGIPTIEIQHGTIVSEHLGYALPPQQRKLSFPDYLWVFGDYWKKSLNLSLPDSRVQVFGYPYFNRMRSQYKHIKKENALVFISQGPIGRELSQFAVEFAGKKQGVKVIYKLHPGERARWKNEYPWLLKASENKLLTVVEGDTPDLYFLLASSTWQIGVCSTAIFEGLGLGCQTFLVNLPNIEYMQPLIKNNYVQVVNKVEDIDLTIKNQPVDTNQFFAHSWKSNLNKLLKQKFTCYPDSKSNRF